jgi:predicted nucleic acid-binding protein
MRLLEAHPELDVADCVHAATALNRGLDAILSPDRAFDSVSGLERVDPADREGVAALGR